MYRKIDKKELHRTGYRERETKRERDEVMIEREGGPCKPFSK